MALRAILVQVAAVLGFAVAYYGYGVETKMDSPGYEGAMCDISASMSCTAFFQSSYGHILSHWGLVEKGSPLDLSLTVAGMLLYGAYFAAACLWDLLGAIGIRRHMFLAVASVGGAFSCYLLYVLHYILEDFCVVCFTFHVVNFSMLLIAIAEFIYGTAPKPKSKRA